MNDASPTINAAVSAAKKVYYVLKNRHFGYVVVPTVKDVRQTAAVSGRQDHLMFQGGNRNAATRFTSVEDLIAKYGKHGVYNGTYSSSLDIVRVEETLSTPSRRIATYSETPTGYVIKEGPLYSTNPDTTYGEGWDGLLDKAMVFASESAAICALTKRSLRIGIPYSSTIVRVIEVPATPTITETVLA